MSYFLPLAALALGTFTTATESHVVIGVLERVAVTLGVSDARAGQLVTAYSLTYALLAPACGVLLATIGRRRGLLLAAAIFTLGNLGCAFADGYWTMMAARLFSGLGAAMFVPAAFAVATELAPPERRGVALSVVFGGMTIASAFAVPLGTFAARYVDWHGIFVVLTGVSLFALGLLALLLPTLAPPPRAGLRARLAPLRTRGVPQGIAVSVLSVLSEFTFYTYISVALADAGGVLPYVLLAFGVGSILGNLAVGVLTDRHGPRGTLLAALLTQSLMMPCLYWLRDIAPVAVAIGLVWGVASYMYIIPIQLRLLSLAGDGGPLTLALNSSAIYAGNALGGALGGVALASLGVASLPPLALLIGLSATALVWRSFPRRTDPVSSAP